MRSGIRWAADGLRTHLRSIVSVAAVLAVCAGLVLLLGLVGILNLAFIVDQFDSFYNPAWVSLSLTLMAFAAGFVLAMPIGLMRAYGPSMLRRRRGAAVGLTYKRAKELYGPGKAIRVVGIRRLKKILFVPGYGLATGYVEGIRGTPFYVQMWLVFFFITMTFPQLPRVQYFAGFVGLTINTVAYQAEVLRAGFQSVSQGQIDAAKAIGMKEYQTFANITLPQSLRLIVLPLTNEWIALFKASAILSFIAIQELMFQSKNIGSNLGQPLEGFVMVTILYLLINIPLSKVVTYVERKKRIPGLGTGVQSMRAAKKRRARDAA